VLVGVDVGASVEVLVAIGVFVGVPVGVLVGRGCFRTAVNVPLIEVLHVAGIHSRRRAADELGVADPDAEFARWLEEQERIRDEAGRSENGRVASGRE